MESLDETYEHGFGILIYKTIADYIMSDLAIGQAVQQMRVLVDVKKPIFAVWVRFAPPIPPIKIREYARLTKAADGIHITIHDETYATDLLKLLWENFGRDEVTQLDRWETVVPHEITTLEKLQDLTVADPMEKMREKILDAVVRIVPEGFRIGSVSPEANEITVVASENPIQPEWIEMVRGALARPPKPLPREKLERVGRKPMREVPGKFERVYKEWKRRI